jgi:nucleoside-diphosphate-sugar epimerase
MTSLVTGATGLIGSHLVETLVMRGENVRALVRPTSNTKRLRGLGVDIRVGNLNDNATLMAAAKGAERVYHCAGLVSDWGLPEAFQEANVQGVRNMLAAATRGEVSKFIYLSTSDIYGFPGRPVVESERPAPRGYPYSDSKVEAETHVWNHYRRVGLPISILRPATVYGPRSQALVDIIHALRRRRMYLIDEGKYPAGLTYIGNLVDAMILAADRDVSSGRAYNITDGNKVTWREYIDAIADMAEYPRAKRNFSQDRAFAVASFWENVYRMLGRTQRPPMTRLMVEWMSTDQSLIIDQAARDLDYRPRVSFREAMNHIGVWWRRQGEAEGGEEA